TAARPPRPRSKSTGPVAQGLRAIRCRRTDASKKVLPPGQWMVSAGRLGRYRGTSATFLGLFLVMGDLPIVHRRQLPEQIPRGIDPPGLLAILASAGLPGSLPMPGGLHGPIAGLTRKNGAHAFIIADAGFHG